ncbi:MAG: beta-ketoacyl synthase chain length factor [Nitrospirota bacterium]|nr:beta-ketoacyl synthase chain length factor [Nitrospirota bacterium]MDH5587504.1 beta-ketoacyl synthase chain length factor [Nitrospirota bacterium]MDH5774622.1 beta-ketoacyl synthase chain length factor [Nitrospirota bacterium]
MKIAVHGIGVLGPGIESWDSCRNVLKEQCPYDSSVPPNPMPSILPANERRRSSEIVLLSLGVAQEAVHHSQLSPKDMAAVFASSGGEVGILHKICQSLASSVPIISPTLFHQSVHNAAAGYWSIASHSQRPSTSLACYDSSFGGGLIEAATLLTTGQEKLVLFAAYDIPAPFPLNETRPLIAPFGMAFVLGTHPLPISIALLDITLLQKTKTQTSATMSDASLEALRLGNPAARGLPLLQTISTNLPSSVYLDFLDNLQLRIDHQPCQPCPS